MTVVQKVKFLLKIKIYLVPNLESTIVRVLVTNVSHLYEMEIEADLTIEKDIVAYIAYVEENGQLVPRVKFENSKNDGIVDRVYMLSMV